MVCANCGGALEGDVRFCPSCGTPTATAPEQPAAEQPGAPAPGWPPSPSPAPSPYAPPWQQGPSASWQPPPEPKRRTGLVVGIIAAAVAVVALVAVVAATNGDDNSNTEDFAIDDTANDSGDYPQFMQDAFMKGCAADGEADFCRCALDRLMNSIPASRMVELNDMGEDALLQDPDVRAAILDCI